MLQLHYCMLYSILSFDFDGYFVQIYWTNNPKRSIHKLRWAQWAFFISSGIVMLSDGSKYTSGEYFISWKIIEYNQSINRTQGDVMLWNTDIFSHLTATSPQRILAYIQANIIDSISIPALVHKYSKVKSEKFTKHLQSVLTTFYHLLRRKLRGH